MDKSLKTEQQIMHNIGDINSIYFIQFVKREFIVNKVVFFHKIYTIFTHTYPHIIDSPIAF